MTTMVRTDTPSPTAIAGLTWQRLAAGALRDDAALGAAWDRLNAARCDLPFLSAYAVVAAVSVVRLLRKCSIS